MAASYRENYLREVDGPSWAGRFGITTNADKLLVHALTGKIEGTQYDRVVAFYVGTAAINLPDYNGFPKGTLIHDEQAHKTHERTATGWVSSAARA